MIKLSTNIFSPIILLFFIANSLSAQLVNSGVWTGSGNVFSSSAGCNTITTSAVNYNNASTDLSAEVMDCDANTYSELGIYGGPSLVVLFDWDAYNSTNGWASLLLHLQILSIIL